MIRLTDINGRKVLLDRKAIAMVREAGTSSQWHGVRSIVKTFDGQTLEIQERADEIDAMCRAEREADHADQA